MARFLGIALVAAAAACAGDLFVDPDAASSDSGPTDATRNDDVTTSDGAAKDGGSTDGSSGDGGKSDGGDPGFSCINTASGTVLCDDFDTANASSPAAKWTAPLATNGVNAFDVTNYRTAPRSYRAQTLANDAGAFANASLLFQSVNPPGGSTFTVRAAVRAHAVDPKADIPVLKVSYVPSTGNSLRSAAITLGNGNIKLQVTGDSTFTTPMTLASFTLDKWINLQVDLNPSTVSAWIDGTVVKQLSVNLSQPSAVSPLPEADLGIVAGSTAFATDIDFDDFLFRIH